VCSVLILSVFFVYKNYNERDKSLAKTGRLRVIIIASLNCVVYKVQCKCCVKTVAVEL